MQPNQVVSQDNCGVFSETACSDLISGTLSSANKETANGFINSVPKKEL